MVLALSGACLPSHNLANTVSKMAAELFAPRPFFMRMVPPIPRNPDTKKSASEAQASLADFLFGLVYDQTRIGIRT